LIPLVFFVSVIFVFVLYKPEFLSPPSECIYVSLSYTYIPISYL
jgi:hypothetical protein